MFELVFLCALVGVEPLDDLVAFLVDLLLVFVRDLVLDFLVLHRLLHRKRVRFEGVLGRYPLALLLVFSLESLNCLHFRFNVNLVLFLR